MKTITISGFIHARAAESWMAKQPGVVGDLEYRFSVWRDGGRAGDALVCEQQITFGVPDDFDPTPAQVAALEKQKAEMTKEFCESVGKINAQLARLQAISNEAKA